MTAALTQGSAGGRASRQRPRLTICIPTVNRAHCVGRAVESALAQTVDEIEILVSNNGSTDGTRDVLARYADPRLRVLHRETTVPSAAHSNLLLPEIRGELFVPMSDDDYLEPDFSEKVLRLADRHPTLSFIYTGSLVHFGESGVVVPELVGPEIESGLDFVEGFFAGRREVCWCACALRTSAYQGIGELPPYAICGDLYYWQKIALAGDVGCVPEPLAHYTFMMDNLSAGVSVTAWAEELRALGDDALARFAARSDDPARIEGLRASIRAYVARMCANHFSWNRMRGASRIRLLAGLLELAPQLGSAPQDWSRIAAGLLLPRPALRTLLLSFARAQSISRRRLPR